MPSTISPVETKSVVTWESHVSDCEAAKEFNTDLSQWTLSVSNGRHAWHYSGEGRRQTHREQRILERYWLGLPFELPPPPTTAESCNALRKAWDFLKHLQTESGTWGANDDGPLFVTSGMVTAMYFTGSEIDQHVKTEMCRYLVNIANDDGGWGLFIDGPSTVFGTTINYVLLRMLGLAATHPVCVKARKLLHSMGTALAIPTWGRFWLCVNNLCSWDGIIPIVPELLLAPRALSVSPGNWDMPIRNIYTTMSYIYGHQIAIPEDALIRELRSEIYQVPYDDIDWRKHRLDINECDQLKPRTALQKVTAFALGQIEDWKVPFFRRRALNEALFYIEAEVHNTRYLCLSPVTWSSNLIALWHAHGPDSHWAQGMLDRFLDPLWMCREGLAASGTDGTAVWDTSLVLSTIGQSRMPLQQSDLVYIERALDFLRESQIREDPLAVEQIHRHPSRGAWPFSTRDQGYSVSDTTAEAMLAIMHTRKLLPGPPRISDERLKAAVDYLLAFECEGGGFGAFEKPRAPQFLENFNMTDSYDDCMVGKVYPECTASVIMAMADFGELSPDYRPNEIDQCIERSVAWLIRAQFPEGGWIGSWGVCFSFATMGALQGLARAHLFEANSEVVQRACDFLLQYQNPDGGWGEALESAKVKYYVHEPNGSQVTQTAYAVIGLLAARSTALDAIQRGVEFILSRQQPAGDWLPCTLEGIHAPPGGCRYPLYKFHFTMKALAMWEGRHRSTAKEQ